MSVAEAFVEILGRELSPAEAELLACLSPQGLAKVNADSARGLSAEETLAQLMEGHEAAKKLKALLEQSLPEAMLPFLKQMGRRPTLEEMVLLTDVPFAAVMRQITFRSHPDEAPEDVLEEIAVDHRVSQVHSTATRLVKERGCGVMLTPLSTTQLCCDAGRCVAVTESAGRLLVGPGPVVTWFQEREEKFAELEDGSPRGSSSGLSSPRSALKKPRNAPASCPKDILTTGSSPFSSVLTESWQSLYSPTTTQETSRKTTELRVSFWDAPELAQGVRHSKKPAAGISSQSHCARPAIIQRLKLLWNRLSPSKQPLRAGES
eukprot:RCo024531